MADAKQVCHVFYELRLSHREARYLQARMQNGPPDESPADAHTREAIWNALIDPLVVDRNDNDVTPP